MMTFFTNKKLKILLAILSLIVLTTIWIIRIHKVNSNALYPKIKYYSINSPVLAENNFLDDINDATMNGYEFMILGTEILNFDDYLYKYGIDKDQILKQPDAESFPDKVYDVKIKITNYNNTDGGINLSYLRLITIDKTASIFQSFIDHANPSTEGSLHIALRVESNMEFNLPFTLYKNDFSKQEWGKIESIPFNLLLTTAPISKRIRLYEER